MTQPTRKPGAELINATVLFADLVGFDRLSTESGTEKAYLAVTRLLRQLDGIARQHGGSVDKYLGDKLMALFGHPLPLENPSRAAAMAALEMRRRVDAYNREADLETPLGIHVGINEGPIVSGEVRGPVVREFHVLGDAVNVAARINAKAPTGEVWVGPAVHDAISGTLTARALEPLVLKGKSRPVEVFTLEAPRHSALRERLEPDEPPACDRVGLDAELAELEEHLKALAEGRGASLHVHGEPGAGKSRLLAELGASPHIDTVRVLALDARAAERSHSASVFAPLLELGDESTRSAAELDGDDALREIESRLSRAASEKPVLLAVENAHLLDRGTAWILDRLRRLAARAPILVLSTGCQALASSAGGATHSIELGELSEDQARALALAVLGDDVEAPLLEAVLERGGRLPGSLLPAAFLAPALRSELEHASSRDERSSEAERRRAAIVFADLTGFTSMTEHLGAEETYPVVAACLDILDEVAREHGGTVDHHLGDCVMATFGVPRAIEDAPRAAINAAIEMRDRIRSFSAEQRLLIPVDVHTGVATGLGIAGDISGPMIREFAVMGDHVDRADALTHIAEAGEIFVDEATQQATRGVFDFVERAPKQLPGDDAPQPTFELSSESVQLHRRQVGAGRQVFSPLVGRDDELREIGAALEAVREGRGGVISLSSEAGIGKSRLLTEARSSREAADAVWLIGRAISNGRSFAYHPVADLLRVWTRIDDDDDDVSARRKLDDSIGAVLPQDDGDTAPLLANMMALELTPEERERIDSIQGEAAEKIVRAAFVRLLRAAASMSPLVIVMEDLQWADLSTVELVESILGLCSELPILFVNVFRPGYEETSGRVLQAARAQEEGRHTELSLVPLDTDAARAMVKNLFEGGDVPQNTRVAIKDRAQGNPFYIEEVVRSLVDAGAIEINDGVMFATAKLESVEIPNSVHEAVMARVDRLDLESRAVLQAASVIGGTFHLDVLFDVLGTGDVEELLEDLEEWEFIGPANRSAGAEYAFKHPLIPEIIYDSLLETRREELHVAVAEATEERLSEAIPGYAAMLAFHFGRGRALERAEEYLFRAGDEASRSAASNEALYFFQEASALYDELYSGQGETAKRARLEKSLAVALMNRGRLIEAVGHFDSAARLLGHDSPRGTVRMFSRFAGSLGIVLAKLYMGRLLGRKKAGERERELFDILFRRAMAQSTTNPVHFLVDSTELLRTLSRYDPLSVPESAALFSGVIAIFALGGLSFDVSGRFLALADELAAEGGVDERVLYYRALGLLHHLLSGDWSDEHTVPDEMLDEAIRGGRFWETSTYLDLDCQRLIYQGRFAEAAGRIERLSEMADLYENELASSARLAHGAFLHEEKRELDEALETIEIYYDEHSEIMFNIVALGTRGRVRVRRGELELAEVDVERGESLIREAGRVPPLHASYVRSARFLLEVHRAENDAAGGEPPSRAALRRLRASRREALRVSAWVPWRRSEALRLAGREAWLRGRPGAALKWWQRALDCASSLGALPELARTYADAGHSMSRSARPLELNGRDARRCIDEASRIFAEIGMRSELETRAEVA